MSITLTEEQLREIDKETDEYNKKKITAALDESPSILGTFLDDQILKLAPILKTFIREHLIPRLQLVRQVNPLLTLTPEHKAIMDAALDELFGGIN